MRASTNAAISLGFALAVLLCAPHARADVRTEARAHFKKGMALIYGSQFEEGIAELKRAQELTPHPNLLFNIARAYVEAGQLEEGIAYYRKYLDGNPADWEEIQGIIASLMARRERLARAAAEVAKPSNASKPGDSPGAPNGAPCALVTSTLPFEAPKPPPVKTSAAKTEDVFAETVVTASRGKSSPLDTPNSTSIITEQDIRLSGITKIPELLRRLAGVEIAEMTGSQTEVGIRGFNQRLSNKVLVLVNGRSVYVEVLGDTLWALLSIGVEDIERIEVVRGPGSALYGADAFNGVINIITRAPGTGESGINAGYGDHSASHGSVWATGRRGDFAWRGSAGFDSLPRWSIDTEDSRRDIRFAREASDRSQHTVRLDARGTQKLARDVTLDLGGGYVEGGFDVYGIGALNDIVVDRAASSDVTAQLNAPHWQLRAFWNHLTVAHSNGAGYLAQSLLPAQVRLDVLDGEVQYVDAFETGRGIAHDLHVGGSYRLKDFTWSYVAEPRSEHHAALFVHDAVKLGSRFTVIGDARFDYVPYLTRVVTSPRGSLLFHPSAQSTIRGVLATAFRTPTYLEAFLDLPVPLPIVGALSQYQGLRATDPNFRLREEKVLTAELGYMNQESDYVVVDTSVYYNQVSDLIKLNPSSLVTLTDASRGLAAANDAMAAFPASYGGFENQCQRYHLLGWEVGARTFPAEGLDVYGNYTLSKVLQDTSRCGAAERAAVVTDERTSMHKVNAGVQLRTQPGIEGSLDFHWVSPQLWAEQVASFEELRVVTKPFHLDGYALLNARLGYRFLDKRAEVSVFGFNVLGYEHRQHPFAQRVGRRVMGFVTLRF